MDEGKETFFSLRRLLGLLDLKARVSPGYQRLIRLCMATSLSLSLSLSLSHPVVEQGCLLFSPLIGEGMSEPTHPLTHSLRTCGLSEGLSS